MLQRWYVGYFFYQFKSDKVKHEQTFLLGMSDINFLSISDMLKHFISDSDRTEVFSPRCLFTVSTIPPLTPPGCKSTETASVYCAVI